MGMLLLLVLILHSDITAMVDWALKNSYLSSCFKCCTVSPAHGE